MLDDNLARPLINETQPKQNPSEEPRRVHRNKPRQKGLTRKEITVISLFGVILFALAVLHISLSMQVSTMNREIQDLQSQTTMVEVENENFEQKVQELSRYDRVYAIAKEHDLEMNEEQIRNVLR